MIWCPRSNVSAGEKIIVLALMLTFNLTVCAVWYAQSWATQTTTQKAPPVPPFSSFTGVCSTTFLATTQYPLPDPPEPVSSLVGGSKITSLALVK